MTEREHQLEVRVVEQETELHRLQEEIERLKHLAADTHDVGAVAAPPMPPMGPKGNACSRPQSARPGSAAPTRKLRYMFSQFPATLLAPPPNGPQLYPCEGLTAVAHEGRVILFGGTNGSTITHDTIAFNLATGRWRRLTPTVPGSQLPSPRYGHSAVLFHNQMIVYGGFGPGGFSTGEQRAAMQQNSGNTYTAGSRPGLLNSLYGLDLHSGEWTCISSFVDSQLPSKNHSAVLHGSRMYVFGGCLPEGRTNAVRCYDIEKRVWLPSEHLNAQAIQCNTAASTKGGTATTSTGTLMAQSDVPAPRSGHTSVLGVRSGVATMIVFGGRLSKYAFSSDVFQYDLQQQTWMRLYCGGDIPEGRCDHSMVIYRDHLVVYGGYAVHENGTKRYFNDVYTLDLVSCTWSRVELTGPAAPLGSCGHASVLFETTDNVVCMATIGGWGVVPEPVSLGDEDAERTLKQHEGDLTYRTINDVWIMQIAKAPAPAPVTASRPDSARQKGRAVSPRMPSRGSSHRPSTARSTRTGATTMRSGSAANQRPAFVTQSSKAATAKLFGDAPMSERVLRMTQGSPKRSDEEVQSIMQRLTSTKVHDALLEALRKKHIKEHEPSPLTPEEQQDITDRVFYQQVMLQEERRKALQSKYVPVQEHEHMSDDQIHEIVSRLNMPMERQGLEPMHCPSTITKQKRDELLKKLYVEDQKHRQEHFRELESKYVWGPPSAKLSGAAMEASVRRLLEGTSPRRK